MQRNLGNLESERTFYEYEQIALRKIISLAKQAEDDHRLRDAAELYLEACRFYKPTEEAYTFYYSKFMNVSSNLPQEIVKILHLNQATYYHHLNTKANDLQTLNLEANHYANAGQYQTAGSCYLKLALNSTEIEYWELAAQMFEKCDLY